MRQILNNTKLFFSRAFCFFAARTLATRERYSSWTKQKRAERAGYPRRWLSYKRRIREDVERLYSDPKIKILFDEKFEEKLIASMRHLEGWQIKLFAYQITIMAFFALTLFSNNVSATIFCISLSNNTSGVKEVLLLLLNTLALLVFITTYARDVRFVIIERLSELKSEKEFVQFAKIARGCSFQVQLYMTTPQEQWIFPTGLNRFSFGLLTFLLLVAAVIILLVGFAFQTVVLLDVWNNSTASRPLWIAAVTYFFVTLAIGILFLVRFWVPLPYRDKRSLKEMDALRTKDPKAYAEAVARFYGNKS